MQKPWPLTEARAFIVVNKTYELMKLNVLFDPRVLKEIIVINFW